VIAEVRVVVGIVVEGAHSGAPAGNVVVEVVDIAEGIAAGQDEGFILARAAAMFWGSPASLQRQMVKTGL